MPEFHVISFFDYLFPMSLREMKKLGDNFHLKKSILERRNNFTLGTLFAQQLYRI